MIKKKLLVFCLLSILMCFSASYWNRINKKIRLNYWVVYLIGNYEIKYTECELCKTISLYISDKIKSFFLFGKYLALMITSDNCRSLLIFSMLLILINHTFVLFNLSSCNCPCKCKLMFTAQFTLKYYHVSRVSYQCAYHWHE